MNCQEFEESLNQSIDAGTWPGDEVDSSPDDFSRHRATCERCRRTMQAFELLRRAIAASASPRPSAVLLDRIERAATRLPMQRRRGRLALAASVLAALGLTGMWLGRASWKTQPEKARLTATAAPTRNQAGGSLGEALAEAAAATWDLARETSDPAARLGRPLFTPRAALKSEEPEVVPNPSASLSVGGLIPSLSALAPEATAAALEQVGDRLVGGIRPLSDSARKAFDRWLGPPRNPPSRQGTQTSTKGV